MGVSLDFKTVTWLGLMAEGSKRFNDSSAQGRWSTRGASGPPFLLWTHLAPCCRILDRMPAGVVTPWPLFFHQEVVTENREVVAGDDGRQREGWDDRQYEW